MYDFDNKTFRVVQNDGPGAEVTTATIFHFWQVGNLLHADYEGGGVRYGKLVGLLEGDTVRHAYTQINQQGQFQSGRGVDQLRLGADDRLQIVDQWQWDDGSGSGSCIMEEV